MPGPRNLADLKKLVAFGSGVGIEIGSRDLEVTVARLRPAGVDVPGSTTIHDYAGRPAGDWGAEYARFLKDNGGGHLAATVVLPRREVIVRQIALPGVARRDLAAAVALQIDTLHPYGEEEVAWGWAPLENGGALVGIVRRTILDRYLSLFTEAGVATAAFTFSAAAIYAAHRIPVALPESPADGFVATAEAEDGVVEVYGESPAHAVFSAEFELPLGRAAGLAISELRLDSNAQPAALDRILPAPRTNPVGNDLARRALPYAAALAGSCPWLLQPANLLPAEHRRSNSRTMYIPTAVLASILVLLCGALVAHPAIENRRYAAELETEIARLEPQAKRAAAIDRAIADARTRVRLLDDFRTRTKADMDALNALTSLLAPPAWTSMIDLTPEAATISGETDQAAPLLKMLDSSPYFRNSTFIGSIAKSAGAEQFQIRTAREPRP